MRWQYAGEARAGLEDSLPSEAVDSLAHRRVGGSGRGLEVA